MSSQHVIDEFESFVASELSTEVLVDVTGEFEDLQNFLNDLGIDYEDKWLGVQYIGSDELPASLYANNTNGKYRETGAIFLHVVEPARKAAKAAIRSRGEVIRDAIRGQRINDVIIESVTPLNFESSATLQFEGGFTSASIVVSYYYDR